MALRLGVRLRKPGVYGLNAQGRAPKEQDTSGAINSGNRVVLAVAVGAALVMSLIGSSSAAS